MSFMSLHTIRGWFTGAPFIRGQDGIRTPAFGLAGHISRSGSALESDGLAVLGGAGATGDSIGMAGIQFTAAPDTTHQAGRFTTETISTDRDPAVAADLMGVAAESTTIRGRCRGLSTEIPRLLGDTPSTEIPMLIEDSPIADTPSTATRAGPAPTPSVGTTMAVRPGVSRRVEARASAVEAGFAAGVVEDFTAARVVAVGGDRGFARFPNELV